MNTPYIETDCTITHEGQAFTNGGSYLLPCTDGKVRGMVYVNEKNHTVTTWHGEFIARCRWVNYRGNFCNMRRVSFSLDGRNFVGDYCPDWSEVVKVRSTR